MSITNATTQESPVQYPSPYKVVDGNLCMEVTEKHSTYDRKLSNFTPYIKSELTIDDGATETKYLRLAGTHANGEVLPEIEVSGKDFPSFNWLFEKWGAKCILEVGKNIREHLRYAIQQTAEYAAQQFIYQQTGWKKNNREWYFLLPGDSKFNVSLKGKLESYCGEQRREFISRFYSALLRQAERPAVRRTHKSGQKPGTHFYTNHGGIYLANRKRNQTISIRLTTEEKNEIVAKAKQAQMTLTDYLIECSRNTDITVTDLSEVLVELKRIGNNLNQIARKINSKRFFFGKFDSVIEGQRKIYDAILSLTGEES